MTASTERADRLALIERWETREQTTLLVVGTRPEAPLTIAEFVRYLYEHLRELPRRPVERMDLMLVGAGIKVEVAARMGSLVREYARELRVLLTGAVGGGETLATLAADAVVMHPMATMTTIVPPTRDGTGAGLDSLVQRLIEGENAENSPYRSLLQATDAQSLGDSLHRLEWARHQLDQLCAGRIMPVDLEARDRIWQLMTRYASRPDEAISRRDVRELDGFPVRVPTPDAESLLFELHVAYERSLALLRADFPIAPRAIIESRQILHTLESSGPGAATQQASWVRHFDSQVH